MDQRRLQVTLPPQTSAGVFDVLVRIAGPDGALEATLVGGFEVVTPLSSPPAVSGLSPASGPSNASLPITITGTDFVSGAQVLFHQAAAPTTFIDDTSLIAITPALEPGNVSVTVRNPVGQTTASALTYVVFESSADAPVISAVTPSTVHAAVAGDVITLFGQALNAQPITAAVVDDGAGGTTPLTVLSVVGAFISARVDGGLPTSSTLSARLTFDDGTDVSSPPFSSSPPTVFAAQVSGGAATEGQDFTLVVAGDQLFPSQLDTATLSGPSSVVATLAGASETTLQLSVSGAVQGTYSLELLWNGGYSTTLSAAVAVAGECGAGVKTPDEACDGTDFGADSCVARGFIGGQLSCTNDCLVDIAACTSCGDGVRDLALGEACDGADLDGATCASVGYDGGELACTSLCTYDASGCSLCGDGLATGDETCDGLDVRGATCAGLGYDSGGPVTCRADCSALDVLSCETCGDGVCTGTETNATCPGDCASTCNDGNNTCDMGEDCSTCPTDCDLCAPYSASIDGDGQSATIGLSLPLPITVTVTDDEGAPVEGATITFSHPLGGLTTGDTGNVSVTNDQGIATATVRLGFGVGEQAIVVTGVGPAGVDLLGLPATLTFTAEDVPVGTVYTIANGSDQAGWNLHPTGSSLLSHLDEPEGIAAHPDGGALVVNQFARRVVHITAGGTMSVAVGSGAAGISGEGGDALDATLTNPRAVAVADDGTIYVGTRNSSTTYGSRVWRVDPVTNIITTYAGGEASFADDGNGRTATDANIEWPHNLALDPLTGDLLIYPGANDQEVRRVDAQTGVIDAEIRTTATCAVTGASSSFPAPNAMAVGPDGTIYLSSDWEPDDCSVGGEKVLAYKPDGLAVPTSVLGGSSEPIATAVDPAGNLFAWVASPVFELRKVDRLGRVTTVFGNGVADTLGEHVPATMASAGRIDGIAVMPGGDLWITDTDCHCVRVIRGVAATGPDPLPPISITLESAGPFSAPQLQAGMGGVRVLGSSADGVQGVLVRAEPFVGHLVDQPSAFFDGVDGLTFYPYGGLGPVMTTVRVLPLTREWEPIESDALLVDVETTPTAPGYVYGVFNTTGSFGAVTDPGITSPLLQRSFNPTGAATGPDGSLYVVDKGTYRAFRIDASGALHHIAGDGARLTLPQEATDPRTQPLSDPDTIEVTPDGDVFVSVDVYSDDSIWRIDATDGLMRRFAGGGASTADGVAAISAQLTPIYQTVWDDDLDRLYIAVGNRLRYVENGIIYSVPLQLGGCSIFTLNGLAMMPNGHLAVGLSLPGCGTFNSQRTILEVDPADGSATELVPGFAMPNSESHADGLAVAADGTLFFELTCAILRRDPDGTITNVTGPSSYSVNDADSSPGILPVGPTTPVGSPRDLALGVDGTLYMVESSEGIIRAISDPASVP